MGFSAMLHDPDRCPTCGQRIASGKVRIRQGGEDDPRGNWVERHGLRVTLTSSQVDILYALDMSRGVVVSLADLVELVYAGGDPPKSAANAIRQQILRLRPKLAKLGMEVSTIHGSGYRLDITEAEK